MRTKQLVAVGVATILLIGGAAAVGAAVPDEPKGNTTQALDDTPGESAANATNDGPAGEGVPSNASEADGPANESAASADTADGIGPSDGLPEQASDGVGDIHDTVESFLGGSIDHLGDSLSVLLSADGTEETEDVSDGGNDDEVDDATDNAE